MNDLIYSYINIRLYESTIYTRDICKHYMLYNIALMWQFGLSSSFRWENLNVFAINGCLITACLKVMLLFGSAHDYLFAICSHLHCWLLMSYLVCASFWLLSQPIGKLWTYRHHHEKSHYFQLVINAAGIWHCLVVLPARVPWGLSLWALGYQTRITSLDQSPAQFLMNYWVLGKAVCCLQARGTWNPRQNLTKGSEMTFKLGILNILKSHFSSREHRFGLLIPFSFIFFLSCSSHTKLKE